MIKKDCILHQAHSGGLETLHDFFIILLLHKVLHIAQQSWGRKLKKKSNLFIIKKIPF